MDADGLNRQGLRAFQRSDWTTAMDALRSLTGFVRYVLMYAYHLLTFPLIAATGLAWLVTSTLPTETLHSPFVWIVGAPVLYLGWLVLTFAVSALNMQIASRLGWSKPARSVSEDSNPSTQQIVCAAIMMRAILFWSLPVTRYQLRIPGLCELVLYSYSPKVSIGRGSQIWGYIYDPDLTTVGEGAILGGGAVVCSHSATTDNEDRMVYTTAPVFIGPRAIIGGESRIGLGVHIGADAIVEPGSVVPAFSRIPEGEVWAGNPVRFQRHRFETTSASKPEPVSSPETQASVASERSANSDSLAAQAPTASVGSPIGADDLAALREIIADNLRLPLASLSESPSSAEYSEWDSLAQMGIAASIATQFGCVLPAEEVFRLTSLDKLCSVVFPTALNDSSPAETESPSIAFHKEEPLSVTDPELLPLLDRSEANHWLSTRPPLDGDSQRTVSIRIAASFTAEPLEASIVQWCSAFGITAYVSFAGFDQVESSLLSPTSSFRSNDSGINVVLFRPEDLADRGRRAEAMLDAIRAFGDTGAGRMIVGTLPPVVSSFCLADRSDVDELRARWWTELRAMPHVELLDFSAVIERLGTNAARQSDMEVVARSPYSTAAFRELGIELARHVRSKFLPAKKVLALDADHTLWGGVVGEDGIDGIQLSDDHPGRSFKLFQQQILRLKNQGVLLVLVSRNEECDVLQVLD